MKVETIFLTAFIFLAVVYVAYGAGKANEQKRINSALEEYGTNTSTLFGSEQKFKVAKYYCDDYKIYGTSCFETETDFWCWCKTIIPEKRSMMEFICDKATWTCYLVNEWEAIK